MAFVAALGATLDQLAIPVLLGRAIDETQFLVESSTAGGALSGIAAALLTVSGIRGLATMVQSYAVESVGHAL